MNTSKLNIDTLPKLDAPGLADLDDRARTQPVRCSAPNLSTAAILLLPAAMPAQTSQWQQDQQTESQVQQAVSVTSLPSIQSSVKNGPVTLTGTVRTDEDKARVSQSLVNVPGIKMVMNNLTVGRPVQAAAPVKATMLAAGTTIPIRLNGEIDTKAAKAGDTFQGTVSANVLSGVTVAIPTGTPMTGRVIAAKAAGRLSGAANVDCLHETRD